MANEDLRFALEAYKAERKREAWKRDLSKASRLSISDCAFLAPDQTCQLRKKFFDIVKGENVGFRKCWPDSEKNRLSDYVGYLAASIEDSFAVLFNSQDAFFGAVRVPVATVLQNLYPVWRVVEEDIALASEDMVTGLCIERGFYDENGMYVKDGVYELVAWGRFADTLNQYGAERDRR